MFFKKLRRYMAFSSGDFQKIFKDFRVPSLPQVVVRLLALLKNPEVSMEEVASVIELDPGLTTQILGVVNSAFIGLPQPIKSLRQAVSVLGLKKIESFAVSIGVMRVVKDPHQEGFKLSVFWTDSLFRALFAKILAQRLELEFEEVFLSTLLQDIALPVLLTEWFDVYRKAYEKWQRERKRLSLCEREVLSWHHAQAGAWLAQKWSLSEAIVCGIGLHIATEETLKEIEAVDTRPFMLTALSSHIPSIMVEEPRIEELLSFARAFGLSHKDLQESAERAYEIFTETASSFGLKVKTPVELPALLAEVKG